ncbi:MAG: transglycosylase SLT domain-containing protein [Bryobacteraceae bacterium]|nr:transglycosylase SLT domain-containing protein [Bryobacteraceae bacterium]
MMRHFWELSIRGRWFRAAVAAALAVLLVVGTAPAEAARGKQKRPAARAKAASKKAKPKASASGAAKTAKAVPRRLPGDFEDLARVYRATPTPQGRAALMDYALRNKDVFGVLARLTLGVTDLEQGRHADAAAHLEMVRAKLPQLDDYTGLWLGTARLEQGDAPGAVRVLEAVWKHTPASPVVTPALGTAARAYALLGQPGSAVALLVKHRDRLAQPKGDAALAGALEAAQDPAGAAAAWQRVYYGYPNSAEAADATAALERLRERLGAAYPPPLPGAMLARADKLLAAKRYDAARREYQTLTTVLTGANRDLAQVRLIRVDFEERSTAAALRRWKSLEVSDPEADAERLFWISAAGRRLEDDSDIEYAVDLLNRKHSASKHRLSALVAAGNRWLVENGHERYENYYRAAAEGFPGEEDGAYAHWKVAWRHYLERSTEAGPELERHLRDWPSSDKASAAMYYLGRMAEERGQKGKAATWFSGIVERFPNSYYAMLSREKLASMSRIRPDAEVQAVLERVKTPKRFETSPFENTAAVRQRSERARLLSTAGLDEWAEGELRFGAKNDCPPGLLAMELAALLSKRGVPDEGIRAIKTMVPGYLYLPMDAAPPEFWRLAFPMPYRNVLETYARGNGLDPFQVAALIRQESEFNPRAVSRAKAYGLTQVLPSTGRQLSRRLGIRRFTTSLLYQPDVNLKIGSYYLRSVLDQYNGRWEPALASYNAGKTRVDRWLSWGNFREPSEFVETIPFTETREYVQIVLRNADIYRKLYGPSTLAGQAGEGRDTPQ